MNRSFELVVCFISIKMFCIYFLQFIGEEPELNIIKSKLEKKNYTIESADPYYIPKSPVELSEEDSEKLYELLQILEEHDDVDKVIVNVE